MGFRLGTRLLQSPLVATAASSHEIVTRDLLLCSDPGRDPTLETRLLYTNSYTNSTLWISQFSYKSIAKLVLPADDLNTQL